MDALFYLFSFSFLRTEPLAGLAARGDVEALRQRLAATNACVVDDLVPGSGASPLMLAALKVHLNTNT